MLGNNGNNVNKKRKNLNNYDDKPCRTSLFDKMSKVPNLTFCSSKI